MDRVIITRTVVGICHMQVCAVMDATDEEILEVCNAKNPSGTSLGWSSVRRERTIGHGGFPNADGPAPCEDDPSRVHILVAC